MKSILSKDLLYPPLKELCSKYPDWLADNRTILCEKDYEQYSNQYLIAKEIVQTFEYQEAGGAGPTSSTSKSQFDRIFELMQKMQTYGHPPKALIGDAPDPFDPSNAMKGCPVQ